MVIECPYCSTRFRFNERSVGARRPILRCSRCRRTFPLPPPPEEDEDETFVYDDDVEEGDSGGGFREEEAVAPPPRTPVRPPPPPAPARSRGDDDQFALPIGRDDDPQPSLFGERDHIADDDEYSIDEPGLFVDDDASDAEERDHYRRFEDDETDGEDAEYEEAEVNHPVQIRSLLAFIALIVGGYALFAWTLRSEPQWARSLMQQVPLVGSEINAVELGREIVLDDLEGRYERTKEGKLIFLITGRARNEHAQAVRGIRVEFRLLGDGDAVLARQSTTCGNAMRPDLVRDLTEEQVRILRGWGTKPPEEMTIKPGESCPIVSIFMDVAREVTSFSGEVVQARRLS